MEHQTKSMNQKILEYYSTPGAMTDGASTELIAALPNEIPELVKLIQGIAIHMYVAESFYGVSCDATRLDTESNLRTFNEILAKAVQSDGTIIPLEPSQRVIGVCHHFAILLVGILRAKRIPARMRYGFGAYFNPGFYEDHSLCEYWDDNRGRWTLVDPQFDEKWVKNLHITHDVLDVPRNQYLVAADAWKACRSGELDPNVFGIFNGDMRGLWFVAGNLVKDIASLNKVEMLQWDAWKGMPRPNNTMQNKKRLAHFDMLAELASDPDKNFDSLQKLYADPNMEVQVPKRVFNAMRRHLEYI